MKKLKRRREEHGKSVHFLVKAPDLMLELRVDPELGRYVGTDLVLHTPRALAKEEIAEPLPHTVPRLDACFSPACFTRRLPTKLPDPRELYEAAPSAHGVWSLLERALGAIRPWVEAQDAAKRWRRCACCDGTGLVRMPVAYDDDLDRLDLSIRARNVFEYAEIGSIQELVKLTPDALRRLPNSGKKLVADVEAELRKIGKRLAKETSR